MEDKSLTSMVITVIVALIVTGAVLVPIIGGLTDNDGGNDGGGGEGSAQSDAQEDFVLLNDIRERYAEIGVSTDITGVNVYESSLTPNLPEPIHITLDDLYEYPPLFVRDGDNTVSASLGIFELWSDDNAHATINLEVESGSNQTKVKTSMGQGGTYDVYLENLVEFEITVGIDYSFDMHLRNDSDLSVEVNGIASSISIYSKDENAWMDMMNMSVGGGDNNVAKIANGSYLLLTILISTNNNFANTRIPFEITSQMLEQNEIIFIGSITFENVEYTLQSTYTNIVPTSVTGVYEVDSNITYDIPATVISPSDAREDISCAMYVTCVSTGTANPMSSGEGDSSDNGDLGTVGMIMAVIPIFVVLAILIYAVQYLRTRPEQY